MDGSRSRKRIACWRILMTLLSLQGVSGWIEFQPQSLSSLGKRHEGRYLLLISSRKEGYNSQIVVFCVGVKKKL